MVTVCTTEFTFSVSELYLECMRIFFRIITIFSISWPTDSLNAAVVPVTEIRVLVRDIIYALHLNSFQLPDYVITGMTMNKHIFAHCGSLPYRIVRHARKTLYELEIFSAIFDIVLCLNLKTYRIFSGMIVHLKGSSVGVYPNRT